MKNSQCGRSMIEMLGVLAIIAILSVGGIAGYSKAMEKYKVNKVIEQVTTIVSNIQILFANEKNIPMLDYEIEEDSYIFVRDFIIPKEIDTEPDKYGHHNFTHALGGLLWFTGDYYNKGFTISIHSLSKESCIALATHNWGGSSSGFTGIEVSQNFYIVDCNGRCDDCMDDDNTNGVLACLPLNNIPLPLTPALAAKGCNCTDKSCIINLLFES